MDNLPTMGIYRVDKSLSDKITDLDSLITFCLEQSCESHLIKIFSSLSQEKKDMIADILRPAI